jgi:diguanylate cyclase (GGDEF)-like protein
MAIKIIANTLKDVLEEKDIIVRFGGEEFIVILIGCTGKRLIQKAQEVRIAFSQQQITAPEETFTKTVSIGVSEFPNREKDFWKYVKQSDIALYEAKQTGRNKVVKYTKDLK